MKVKGDKLERLIYESVILPDGTYTGYWGGYVVEFHHEGQDYTLKTSIGIKGINIPCVITIKGDDIEVFTI